MSDGRSIELFTGAGGLALGLENSGWRHDALIEWNRDACATIRLNREKRFPLAKSWNLIEEDVSSIDYTKLFKDVALVAGGPPCQPFSLGGKHRGQHDRRDMFPEAVRAVRELCPMAFVFENVRGLMRESFSTYFNYVILQLTHPTVARRPTEDIEGHLRRLEKRHTANLPDDLQYQVVFRCLNAADYGVPQNRYRVFIVGFRSDLGRSWAFPKSTHNYDKLLWSKWVTGDYWEEHKISKSNRAAPPAKLESRIERLRSDYVLFEPSGLRVRTVRDALKGIDSPLRNRLSSKWLNHEHREGARTYPGHTGSQLDEPAKTLKAGDHGVPGGENMFADDRGMLRYFSAREGARLQTFPDDYEFAGSWSECMRQIGNAVPVQLAQTVGRSIRSQLN